MTMLATREMIDFTTHGNFPYIDRNDERGIEKFNRAVNEEMSKGVFWIEGPMSTDGIYVSKKKKVYPKCTCPICHVKHTVK